MHTGFAFIRVIGIFVGFSLAALQAGAEEEAPAAAPRTAADSEAAPPDPNASQTSSRDAGKAPRSSKGRRTREKEAEGTEAHNRFQPDTVAKSKYELDGQPLEVDPD